VSHESLIGFVFLVGAIGGVTGFAVWRIVEALFELHWLRDSLQRDRSQAECVALAVASVPAVNRAAAHAAMQRLSTAPGPARGERAGPGVVGRHGTT
jgi:hypothetical protein